MPTYKTPDVYVEEISIFPPSVAEVETAVPAFIGYTATAKEAVAGDLLNVPTKIYSFKEYEQYFGVPSSAQLTVTVTPDTTSTTGFSATFAPPAASNPLYYAVKLYFDNGGGKCYIVSVGALKATPDKAELLTGLGAVKLEDEPTLLVIPEATGLTYPDFAEVAQQMIAQCHKLGDRFAIIDAYRGDLKPDDKIGTDPADVTVKKKVIEANRNALTGDVKYAAAYYPFIRTTLNYYLHVNDDKTASNVLVTYSGGTADLYTHQTTNTALFNFVKSYLGAQYLVMPPSGAVAGVYAATDASRGVWKAPANVPLADVLEPVVKIDNELQDDLNVDATSGKSINAIRSFVGKGTLVWGARTLAGNDNEWRYVSVRRFFNMVEESVKKSTHWAVFEPNDANTWVKVRGMIENYLTQKWREGALAGATTKDAFFVKCGLGITMTAQDILEGRMNVEIGMAAVRPAEFIILKFSHKLQTS